MKVIRSFFRLLYKSWCAIWFVLPFLVLYPFYLLFTVNPRWYRHAHNLNRFWSSLQLKLYGIPVKTHWRTPLAPGTRYVYCSNHSSYIDIPLLLKTLPGFINFLGKSSLTRIPLWGRMFQKLYIPVNRHSPMSMARSYFLSVKTLEEGRDVVIFPEGTIPETAGSQLLPFKDGPFKLAIEKQVPVVPITMPYNHIFLPAITGKFIVNWHPLEVVIHEPIPTTGLTRHDLEKLKSRVFNVIQNELNQYRHDNRYSNAEEVGALSPSGI